MTDTSIAAFLSAKIYDDLEKGQVLGDTGRFLVKEIGRHDLSAYFGAVIQDTLTGEVILANRGTDLPSIDLIADSFIVTGDIPTPQFNAVKALLASYEDQFSSDPNYVPVTTAVGHPIS